MSTEQEKDVAKELADAGSAMFDTVTDIFNQASQFAGSATIPRAFVVVFDEMPLVGNSNVFCASSLDPRTLVALVSEAVKMTLQDHIRQLGGDPDENLNDGPAVANGGGEELTCEGGDNGGADH